MSPLSTSLPAPAISFEQTWEWPGTTSNPNRKPGAVANTWEPLTQRNPVSWNNQPAPQFGGVIRPYGNVVVGAFAAFTINNLLGRRCIRVAKPDAGLVASGWAPSDWFPSFDPAGENPGAFHLEASVVSTFTYNLAAELAGATPSWPDDSTGFCFLPRSAGTLSDEIPGGGAATTTGGFGIFCNTDGVGGTQWEYVSWNTGAPGAVLRRVALPVPNIALMNSFRVIILGAASGRSASVEVQVNGVTLVTDTYGSATLQLPSAAAANATGLYNSFSIGTGTDALLLTMMARFGRYTPSGTEIQGE